jgi:uncharacterized protein YfaS (alpha-2-macroglobulin family)
LIIFQVPAHLADSVDYYLEVEATEYGQLDGSEFRYRRRLVVAGPARHTRLVLLTDRPVYRPGTTVAARAWLVAAAAEEDQQQRGGVPVHMTADLLGPAGLLMATWPRRAMQAGRPGRLQFRLAARAPLGRWTIRASLGTEVGWQRGF